MRFKYSEEVSVAGAEGSVIKDKWEKLAGEIMQGFCGQSKEFQYYWYYSFIAEKTSGNFEQENSMVSANCKKTEWKTWAIFKDKW